MNNEELSDKIWDVLLGYLSPLTDAENSVSVIMHDELKDLHSDLLVIFSGGAVAPQKEKKDYIKKITISKEKIEKAKTELDEEMGLKKKETEAEVKPVVAVEQPVKQGLFGRVKKWFGGQA